MKPTLTSEAMLANFVSINLFPLATVSGFPNCYNSESFSPVFFLPRCIKKQISSVSTTSEQRINVYFGHIYILDDSEVDKY